MTSVATLAYWQGLVLLGGFFEIIFWRLLTRQISLAGLLQADDEGFSPARAQMLMVTLLVAMQYLMRVIQLGTAFPELPQSWLAALGASHGVYLGGKARIVLFKHGAKSQGGMS